MRVNVTLGSFSCCTMVDMILRNLTLLLLLDDG